MARSENRQLSITAKLIDLMTKPLGQMQGKFLAFGKTIVDRSKSMLASVFNLRNAVIGLAASFLSVATIKTFGEQATQLLQLSRSTGDTVENLSDLQAAFELAGVGVSDFGGLLKSLETQAAKALADGKLRAAFADVGVTIRDLQTLGPSQLFEKMAAGLAKYSTAQEKSAALGKVLPEQFLQLLPALDKGLAEFQKFVREARDSGATVTTSQAEAAKGLDQGMTKLKNSIGSVSRALLEQFGPEATRLLTSLSKLINDNRDGFVRLLEVLSKPLQAILSAAADAVIELVGLIEGIPGVNLMDQTQVNQQIEQVRVAFQGLHEVYRQGLIDFKEYERQAILLNEIDLRLRQERSGGLRDQLRRLRSQLSEDMKQARELIASQGGQETSVTAPGGQVWTDVPMVSIDVSVFGGDKAKQDLQRVGEEAEKLRTKAEDVAKKMRVAFGGDFWQGFSEGTKNAIAEITDFGRAGQAAANSIVSGGFNGLSDAFADVLLRTKSLKEALKDFARSFLQDLARIITRMIIVKTLQAAIGGGGTGAIALEKGGVVEGTMGTPLRKFAAGGVTNGPTLALFGEGRNREAFVPLPDNRTIPVTLTGGGGGDTHVHFNVSTIDARSVQQMLLEQGPTIAAVVAERAGSRTKFRQDLAKATR